jgi:hypothetical protein
VAAMVSTMTSWLVKGRPRQFIEVNESNRCSILFHLLVSGQCRCLKVQAVSPAGEDGIATRPLHQACILGSDYQMM